MEDLNDDRPPAGTRCATCHAMGHYCPAKAFQGMTDVGVCDPCFRDEDCSVIAAIKLRDEDAFVDQPLAIPAPARVVPPEEWGDGEILKQSTTESQDDRVLHRWGRPSTPEATKQRIVAEPMTISHSELARRYGLSIATVSKIRREAGLFLAERPKVTEPAELRVGYKISPQIREHVLREPRDMKHKDVGSKYGISAASVINIKRDAGVEITPLPQGPRPGVERGAYKQPQKDAAAERLIEGRSLRDTAAEVGLSKAKVIEVKKSLPDAPARANYGGMPTHKPKEEVMSESTPLEIAQAAYVDLCSAIMECEALYRAAKMPLPEPLFRFLNEPVRMKELAIVKHDPAPSAPSSTAYPHLLFEGLIGKLPAPGSTWLSKDRIRWMDTVIKIVDLLYEDPEAEDWIYSVSRDSLK